MEPAAPVGAAGFDHYVAIDWSGAVGPRQPGIAIAICTAAAQSPALVRPGHIWSRADVLAWLTHDAPDNALIGMDISPGFPFNDDGAYFPGWHASPPDARALWALVDDICADDADFAAGSFVDHPEISRYFRRSGGRTGDRFGTGRGRLRVVEHGQRALGLSPSSCFNLIGAAQVGKASLTAMRLLNRLPEKLPVWPFDLKPNTGSVIVEIYTSLAARAAGVGPGRSKMRSALELDTALAALGCEPHVPLSRYTDHATDVILTAAWLRTVSSMAELWHPTGLDPVRTTEGWTFGVF